MAVYPLTRRKILAAAAGGIVAVGTTGLWLGIERIRGYRFRRPVDREGFAPNVYLGILPSNRVEIWVTRSEMGQGVSTALPMLIAEELDADFSQIVVHQAVAGNGLDYGLLTTVGSSSISSLWVELRRAGALAREMLVSAAADLWGVGIDDCVTDAGYVTCADRRISYGDLAEAASIQWAPIRPTLKTPDQFKLIGRSPARLDVPAMVTGSIRYGFDVEITDLVRAVILRPPVHGQIPDRIDAQAARGVTGVVGVLPISTGVAVIATTTWGALKARRLLKVDWKGEEPRYQSSSSIASQLEDLRDAATTRVLSQDEPVTGDLLHHATYQVPFLAHACMEPMNCTVRITPGSCELWVGTQAPNRVQTTAARVTGLSAEQVRVNVLPLGGGFGRRAGQDFIAEAVEIARDSGRSVQLIWSREDDLGHGAFRDAATFSIAARGGREAAPCLEVKFATATAVDRLEPSGGQVMGWDDMPYRLGGLSVHWAGLATSMATTIWRSVGYSYNVFALECFVDELSEASGADPLNFRRSLLRDNALLSRCLEQVVVDAGWADRNDRALGLATYSFGRTAVALVAEVSGEVADWRVTDVWCVVDAGTVVHPDGAAAQIEGGIVFGLSAALYESVIVEGGTVITRNYDRYRLARMSDIPEVHVRFLPSDRRPSGLGEASTPAIAPAVANALYQLLDERQRSLPLKS